MHLAAVEILLYVNALHLLQRALDGRAPLERVRLALAHEGVALLQLFTKDLLQDEQRKLQKEFTARILE